MAKSPHTRTPAGARTPPPAEVANPTPQVGSTPETPAVPEPAPAPPIEFEPPPAMVASEPAPGAEMITVETTGSFMLQDPGNLQVVPHNRSKSMEKTPFIETAIDDGRLTTKITKKAD